MEDLTGMQFGPYQIVAPLGEGGMAAVYKAYQPGMDRYVALKILPRHFASDPTFVQRFEREARIIARLQHIHILPVFDYGSADGYTYFVMPFVETGTLAHLLRGEPLPLPQIIRIISQIGDALDYAHSHGVIHRDIKPSNILIDERGNCLLADFGIGKVLMGTTQITATGDIIGTPAYMSPEQGLGKEIDSRSDIYSLGVVLYEMVTGRQPFSAETPMAVIIKHIHDPLPPPRSIDPSIPEPLERVILKSLAKDRLSRFETAGKMVKKLQSIRVVEERYSPSAPTLVIRESNETQGGVDGAGLSRVDDRVIPPKPAESRLQIAARKLQPLLQTCLEWTQKRRFRWGMGVVGGLIILGIALAWTLRSLNLPVKSRPEPLLSSMTGQAPNAGWMVVYAKDKSNRQQRYRTARTITDLGAAIEMGWEDGFDAGELAFGDGYWMALFSRNPTHIHQMYFTNQDIVEIGREIESKWAQGFDVTQLVYGDGLWLVLFSKSAENYNQRYRTTRSISEIAGMIQAEWDQGYDVTELAYGDGLWVILFSKGSQDLHQRYYSKSTLSGVIEYIEGQWAQGFDVTDLVYGDRLWFVMLSESEDDIQQRYKVTNTIGTLGDDIIDQWNRDFDVSELVYGSGR
jgi:serine/threonine protein kinase